MKIIKPGVDYSNWSIEKTCTVCSAVLDVEVKDIYYDSNGNTWRAECCVCKSPIYILKNEIPELVQREIIKNRYIRSTRGDDR